MLAIKSLRLLLFVLSTTAYPSVKSSHAVKEAHHIPEKWKRVSRAPADHVLKLDIALKQSQFGQLERELYEGMHSAFHLIVISN